MTGIDRAGALRPLRHSPPGSSPGAERHLPRFAVEELDLATSLLTRETGRWQTAKRADGGGARPRLGESVRLPPQRTNDQFL